MLKKPNYRFLTKFVKNLVSKLKIRLLRMGEKPSELGWQFAIPGAYIYDANVSYIAKNLAPSSRGELEISDINRAYLRAGSLTINYLPRGFVWIDIGTPSRMNEAANYIQIIERRQGVQIGCPEEAALQRGLINLDQFNQLIAGMPDCEYKMYLRRVEDQFINHAKINK